MAKKTKKLTKKDENKRMIIVHIAAVALFFWVPFVLAKGIAVLGLLYYWLIYRQK